MKKGGDKITEIKPNLQDKVANKIAGMVDIVARCIADGNVRSLSFKTSEVIFGGGRLTVSTDEIPLDYDAFVDLYQEANKNAVAILDGEEVQTAPTGRRSRGKKEDETPVETTENKVEDSSETEAEDNTEQAETADNEPPAESAETEEKPRVRTRRKRGE